MLVTLNTYDYLKSKIQNYNSYIQVTKNEITCYYRGLIFSKNGVTGDECIQQIIDQYYDKSNILFDTYYGAYHIILFDRLKNQLSFFSDNAGNCCFYYSADNRMLADNFLELREQINITPDYEAITQFLSFSCIYYEATVCNEIKRTDATNYYVCSDNTIVVHSKDFERWDNPSKYDDLHSFMRDLVKASEGLKTVGVITGGIDSRTVLAHLIALEKDIDLAISGREQNIDEKKKKNIAEKKMRENDLFESYVKYGNMLNDMKKKKKK